MIDPNGFMQRPGPEVSSHEKSVVRAMVNQWAAKQVDPASASAVVFAAFGDSLDD